ncbi:hypothetical protein [Bifidobacterium vansinderenii]|uniref:Head-to-tail stopper n=1 Tax=Bifidobacterium vansinderenii TaxID=1984871 RepID=A0A229VW87_9BIFI|nr:hypothetical protein [Bifidobacterium vansinderenii]OXM99880.1 hypothetical protein Tam10B_1843 [Bifidobacterium vansinderenii]
MLPSFCTDTVSVFRAPLVEDRGAQIRDWNHATSHDIGGCSVQPANTSLMLDQPRETNTVIRFTAFLPPDADVEPGDKIIYRNREYAIDGEPFHWPSATGNLDYTLLNLVDWEG